MHFLIHGFEYESKSETCPSLQDTFKRSHFEKNIKEYILYVYILYISNAFLNEIFMYKWKIFPMLTTNNFDSKSYFLKH